MPIGTKGCMPTSTILAGAADMPAEELVAAIYEAMALELDVVGVGDILEAKRKAIETLDLESRVVALEQERRR
jgi:hypothetical protein